jgi:hypothetical protein
MLTSTQDSVQERDARELDANIALLKMALQKTRELRVLLDGFGRDLSYEFEAPRIKVERALAYSLLLREELRDQP